MAFSLTQNISKALSESDDLETAVNRAFYFEPVSYVLKKFSFFGLTEDDIVKKSAGDGKQFTNLLMEHHKAFSTFGIANNNQSPSKTTKKQPATTSPKTISTVMTEYMPRNKNLI
ncbi:hypothetical protein RhiirA4_472436 [Rhizophagus irregularis]|uniref:Uncharacterized protein n=1 Tax=Rhizophagus irregularis TaxID=588596 RepID=A0A2I1H508_9GLOM|nr:hypothetical protein RhiirA4_472436 [Rhizophagus irregularis]